MVIGAACELRTIKDLLGIDSPATCRKRPSHNTGLRVLEVKPERSQARYTPSPLHVKVARGQGGYRSRWLEIKAARGEPLVHLLHGIQSVEHCMQTYTLSCSTTVMNARLDEMKHVTDSGLGHKTCKSVE